MSAWLIGRSVVAVSGDRNAPWILGRAAGFTSYVLLIAAGRSRPGALPPVAYPLRAAQRRHADPAAHSLAVFTLAFVVLHVVVLAADSYAGVGAQGVVGADGGDLPSAARFPWRARRLRRAARRRDGRLGGTDRRSRLVADPQGRRRQLRAVWVHGLLAGSDTRPSSRSTSSRAARLSCWHSPDTRPARRATPSKS